jgi:hypothetical protein
VIQNDMTGGHPLVGLSRPALQALRTALFRTMGDDAAVPLQEAGFTGAPPVHAAFSDWLAERNLPAPHELPAADFGPRLSAFLSSIGWGTVDVTEAGPSVLAVDAHDWAESDQASPTDYPACHLTTGMLSDLLGRIGDVPLAVLEVECRTAGHRRCRFLLGPIPLMQRLYNELDGGDGYEAALARAVA